MFEKATRMKLRFGTRRGNISTEDLWDLPLLHKNGMCLDVVAKDVNKLLKASEEESFVKKASKESEILKLKLDIIKHIIATKIAEIKAAEDKVIADKNKEKIMNIIENKEDEALWCESHAVW